MVPAPLGSSSNSIVLDPSGTGFCRPPSGSQPNVCTSRCGASSSTNSPFATCPSITSTRYPPPGRGSSHARLPNQLASLSGSTRNSHTVSGLASIASSRSTALSVVVSIFLPLLPFGLALERDEAFVPEFLQKLLQLGEPFRAGAIEPFRPVASLAHEPRLLEDAQMLRDRRPRHVEMRSDLAGGELAVADEGQDLAAPRTGDRFERCFHER